MPKRVIQFSLVIMIFVFGTASAVASPLEEVPIHPVTENVVYKIGPGQIGVIQSGWIACNKGLVKMFLKASHHELTLKRKDGSTYLYLSPEEMDELWSPIEILGVSDWCEGNQKEAFSFWRVPLTDLPVGEYELHFFGWIDHPVTDGGDYDGDGTPDVLPTDFYGGYAVNTVIVEE